MTTELTADEILARLSLDHIYAAAAWAARQLHLNGVAVLDLAPGDATRYRLTIVAPRAYWAEGTERPGREYLVALTNDFGQTYPWDGQDVHPSYAASKWARDSRLWTGVVIARFLNDLRVELRAQLT